MKIQDGSNVTIHYTLKVDDQVVDSSAGKEPLEYTHGQGQIVPGLEEELSGMTPGDKKDVEVEPQKGYGENDPNALRRLPRTAFKNPENLDVGTMVAGTVSGKQFQARVAEIEDEFITLDLNHPLAGKTLHFSVEVVHVG